jgi:hypothetical protein
MNKILISIVLFFCMFSSFSQIDYQKYFDINESIVYVFENFFVVQVRDFRDSSFKKDYYALLNKNGIIKLRDEGRREQLYGFYDRYIYISNKQNGEYGFERFDIVERKSEFFPALGWEGTITYDFFDEWIVRGYESNIGPMEDWPSLSVHLLTEEKYYFTDIVAEYGDYVYGDFNSYLVFAKKLSEEGDTTEFSFFNSLSADSYIHSFSIPYEHYGKLHEVRDDVYATLIIDDGYFKICLFSIEENTYSVFELGIKAKGKTAYLNPNSKELLLCHQQYDGVNSSFEIIDVAGAFENQ